MNKEIDKESNDMTKSFKRAIDNGCVIWPTSCTCGGNYAWLTPTGYGTYIMYGCICHNAPPDIKGKWDRRTRSYAIL